MTKQDFVNTIGLIITLLGGSIGAFGYFQEKNLDLYKRSLLYFFNKEYFLSLLGGKYCGICGFILISIGSIIQLFSIFIPNSSIINSGYYWLIPALLLFSIFIVKIVKSVITKSASKILIPIYINEFLKYKDNIEFKKQMDDMISELGSMLKVPSLFENEQCINWEQIIEKGKAFCQKHNIDLNSFPY